MLYSGTILSEEPSAPTFRVEKWHFFILKMYAAGSFKIYQTTWHYIPEGHNLDEILL
jgi:hypothetical protein